MKGIVLAGGLGSRLFPATKVVSKHLLQVYDKPMIYYSLTTLILAGVKDILVITTSRDLEMYKSLIEDLSLEELNFSFVVQNSAGGLPQAFLLGENFIGSESVVLILGDNFFHGTSLGKALQLVPTGDGATVFGYHVSNPEDYGVMRFDSSGQVVEIVEKPTSFVSNFAIPGIYFFDNRVVEYSKQLKPSARGELEIVDLLKRYLSEGQLRTQILPRGTVWMDMGSFENLFEVSSYVRTLQKRQGLEIGNPVQALKNL
jgi:glucose-1-phosphate thymidylyltransferase